MMICCVSLGKMLSFRLTPLTKSCLMKLLQLPNSCLLTFIAIWRWLFCGSFSKAPECQGNSTRLFWRLQLIDSSSLRPSVSDWLFLLGRHSFLRVKLAAEDVFFVFPFLKYFFRYFTGTFYKYDQK